MNFLLKFLKVIFIFFILLELLLKPVSSQLAHYKSLSNLYSHIIYPNDQNLSGEYCQIIQDRQDNTYLASDHGVLKFNGKGWSFIGMPGRIHLALSDDQVLYAGGADTIAIVTTDFNGQLCLTPLPCRSTQSGFNPGQISRIIALGNEVYILSDKGLFTFINGVFTGILTGIDQGDIFKVSDQIYVYSPNLGLQQLSGTSLIPLLQPDQLNGYDINEVFSMNGRIVITAGKEMKLYEVSDKVMHPLSLPCLDESSGIEVCEIKKLSEEYLLLVTGNNDLMICNTTGDLVSVIPLNKGSGGTEIRDIYFDGLDNLWLLHKNYITRVELFSPVTFLSFPPETAGQIKSFAPLGEQLIVSASTGLYALLKDSGNQVPQVKKLLPLSDSPLNCQGIVPFDNSMLVCSDEGIYQYTPGSGARLVYPLPATIIARSVADTMVVYTCTESGITILKFENNIWTELGKAEGIEHPVTSIAETKDGFVWAGTYYSGLYRATVPGDFLPGAKIRFTHESDWPVTIAGAVRLVDLNHKLLVSTSSGLFQYDEASGTFTLHPIHKYISGRPDLMQPVVAGTGTKTWFGWYDAHAGRTILMSFDHPAGSSEAVDTLEYRRLEKIRISAMLAGQDALWLAAPDGLVRAELNYPHPDSPHFFTFIDRIIIDQDSAIDRAFLTARLTAGTELSRKLVIPYSRNSICFEFVSTDYNSEGHALFQYLLTDKNKHWTEWTENNFTDLQDLPGGSYVFRVRSKDIYGNVSAPAQIAFRIKVPFYAAWWAFIFYAFTIMVIIYFYRKWKLFQRLNEQYKLEEIVLQRTESLLKDKEKTDSLLANILPQKTADELKSTGKGSTSKYNMVTVLFSDIQGFTKIAEQMNPERLIDELDKFYFQFDSVVEKYNIEKIKTIGDAYMAAGGIPVKNRTNPVEVVLAGLEMQHFMNDLKKSKDYIWDLRIGIHTGSVIAGVVGQKKFSYDIWGDTVNTASRMESSGEAGKVNISGTCFKLVEQFFDCEYRGKMPVKYKGDIDMYFVKGLKPEYRAEFEYSGNHNLQVQLQLLRIHDLEEIILKRLETDLPEYLFYHNSAHTAHVYAQVELLGRSEKISDEEMLLVRTAALLHDIGYIYQFEDHEIKSVEVAREILAPCRFTQEQIDKICQLILATRFSYKPENLLEKIIIDANLDHLGRVDFLILSDRLFQEYRTMNIINSKKEWNEHQINFLSNHEFFTAAANSLREISKKDQIENIRKFS